jgi:hypothetical protein
MQSRSRWTVTAHAAPIKAGRPSRQFRGFAGSAHAAARALAWWWRKPDAVTSHRNEGEGTPAPPDAGHWHLRAGPGLAP